MDPIQEEKQALSQQEEFESRLFAENDYVVIACVPVTKAGVNDRSGVPKQYFLVLTVHKNDITDCKLHTVRVKNNGLDLVIQKSPKLSKLKWFEIVDIDNNNNNMFDFKLYWKNGSNESFALSPNTLRSVNLFSFIIYNVGIYCNKHTISIKPLELVELEVHGREWLDKIFNNNLLFRRINQIQQDIFTPIYKRLALNISSDNNNNNNNENKNNKRRLSLRIDSNNNTQSNNKSLDVPLMTAEETANIKQYMEICNVSIDNIHLLESKLMEKQRDIMKDNISAFKSNENKLTHLLDNIDNSIASVKDLQSSLNQYKRHINKMESGVSQIKKKNHSLAIQDQNNTKLTSKLTEICQQLKLHAKYEQTLKNPSFKPDTEYKRSLKAVDILSNKLNLTFTDGLESMRAVKSQRDHFKTLNERFCSEACSFLNDLFIKRSAINNNNNTTTHFIGPHTPIHAILFKYDELLKHISSLHSDKFSSILSFYEKSFSKLYLHEFKQYFQYIKTTISKETYASNNNTRMANFTTVNLLHLINNDDIELSQSTASTIFSKDRMADKNATKDANRSMPIINESESDDTKKNITVIYRQCLKEILPIIIIEQQFMETYFLLNNNNNKYGNNSDIERILTSMFSHLENQFIQIIDKADSINNFNTLEMLIISERTLHSYRDYSSFLASLLSKLHTKLTLNWNKFISQEIDWIKSQKISIKQAGILLPVAKFPAFCNEMYKVVTVGDEKSKEITDINTLIPTDSLDFIQKNSIKREVSEEENNNENNIIINRATSNPFNREELKQEKKENVVAKGIVVFRESEQVTNTIHKMTTMLFHWLEKAAISDPKYTHVCLMENYHYFYSVFSKTESLRAIREHVIKAKKNYDRARRSYVKWCVRYECKTLTEFWDDFEQKSINDIETVSVYISSKRVKEICIEYLDNEKKIKKFVIGMFTRLKKHLGNNDILFSKIWRKIAEYFCSKYKKFKENVDKIYNNNNNNKNKNKNNNNKENNNDSYLKYSMEYIWNQFVDQYRNAFGQGFDDNSSIGSSSIGGSSMVSGMTGVTSNSYYSSYTANTKVKVQANLKDKQNKAKKGLSTLKKKSKNKLFSRNNE